MDSRLFLRDEEIDNGVDLIFSAERQLRAVAQATRAEAGLSAGQFDVLMAIKARRGRTVNQVRDALFMTVPTFARILGQLDARALVRKQKERGDGRRRQLYLSDAGEAIIGPIAVAMRGHMRGAYRAAGAESVAGARATLDAIMMGPADG